MIIKPRKLGVVRQVSASADGFHLWMTALAAFDLISPDDDLLDEQHLWQTAASTLGQTPLDVGMPKKHPEVLVVGDACAPIGEQVTSLTAGIEIGSTRKRVAAFGRRIWQLSPDGPIMTPPEPFERISLIWNNAFGGPDFQNNPEGKGANAMRCLKHDKPAELPMVEIPDRLIHDVRDRPEPAGLGPRREDHPYRQRYAGTYGEAWLRNGFPGLPNDLDLRFFNTACRDQWLDEELKGGEFWRIINMHPEHAELKGHLPQFRIRCFVLKSDDTFIELEMRCDTVWFFPGSMMGILIFRGGIPALDREAEDIEHILMGYERISDAVRPLSHYRDALDERTDPERAAHTILNERPLKPERTKDVEARIEAERQELLREVKERAERSRERAIATGFRKASLTSPPRSLFHEANSIMTPEMPVITRSEINRNEVDIGAVFSVVDDLRSVVGNQLTEQSARAKKALGDAFGHLADRPRPAEASTVLRKASRLADRILSSSSASANTVVAGKIPSRHTIKEIEREISDFNLHANVSASDETGDVGRTSESAPLRKARNRALRQNDPDSPFERVRTLLSQSELPELRRNAPYASPRFGAGSRPDMDGTNRFMDNLRQASHPIADPDVKRKLSLMERMFANGIDDHGDDTSNDPAKAKEEKLFQMREEIGQAEDRTASGMAELRRISPDPIAPEDPLSDTDARELGSIALTLVKDNGNLRERDLAGADLAGADLSGLDLRGVFLEGAKLRGARLIGTQMQGAVLTRADIRDADIRDADMSNANLCRTDMRQACLEGVRMDNAIIHHSRWAGADLSRARFQSNMFLEADLEGANLAGAMLSEVSFIKCNLSGISLDTAELRKTVFVETSLAGFGARNAKFESCAIIGAEANGTDLSGMTFANSSFIGGVRLRGAKLSRIDSTGSCWREADLTAADLSGARLDKADLGATTLEGACLRRASLKQAILHRANVNKANFFGASLLEAQARAADLTDASFHRANLYAADLTDAVLDMTDLTGANLDCTIMKLPADV